MADDLIEFLKKHVNGKTLYTDEISYTLEDGRILGTYSDQKSLSNMFFSKTRYAMDKFIVAKEKVVDTETGEVIREEYYSSLYRYGFARRQSTGDINGIMALIGSSLLNDPAQAMTHVWLTYDVKYKKNDVSWVEDEMLYRDRLLPGGIYEPVAYKARCRLYLTNNGLVYEYLPEFFKVDPVTLERTPDDSKFPLFVSKERRL